MANRGPELNVKSHQFQPNLCWCCRGAAQTTTMADRPGTRGDARAATAPSRERLNAMLEFEQMKESLFKRLQVGISPLGVSIVFTLHTCCMCRINAPELRRHYYYFFACRSSTRV